MRDVFPGIDVGSTIVKVVVLDRSGGRTAPAVLGHAAVHPAGARSPS